MSLTPVGFSHFESDLMLCQKIKHLRNKEKDAEGGREEGGSGRVWLSICWGRGGREGLPKKTKPQTDVEHMNIWIVEEHSVHVRVCV